MKSISRIANIFQKSFFTKSSLSIQLANSSSLGYKQTQLFKTQQKRFYNCDRYINIKFFYTLRLKNFTSINKERDSTNSLKDPHIKNEHVIHISYPSNLKEEEYKLAESIRITSACVEVFIFC